MEEAFLVPDIELVEQLPQGIAIYEPLAGGEDFILQYINPAGAALTRRERDPLIGHRLTDLFPGAAGLGLIDTLRRVLHGGVPEHLETARYSDDHCTFWADNQVYRLRTGALMAVFQDRSAQVASEQAGAAAETRYRQVFENSLVGIFIVSAERVIIEINRRAGEIFGFPDPSAAIGRSIELVHVSHATFVDFGKQVFSHLEADGVSNIRYQLKRQNGELFWAELSGKPINGRDRADGVVWVIADVTAAIAAQTALHDSETRYSLAVAGANDGLWDWKIPANEVYFSPRWKEILGYRDDEIPNRFDEWQSRVHPDDLDQTMQAISSHLAGLNDHFEAEFRMRRKDGAWCWILARARCIRDQDGRPIRMAGSHTDIDARKLAEQRSEADRRRLATVFETVQTGIAIVDVESQRIVEANAQAAHTLGLEREALIGARCSDWLCTDPSECPFRGARTPVLNRETTFRHRAGHRLPVLQSAVPLDVDGDHRLLESYVDISAQKAAQRELRAAKEAAEAAALAKSEFLAKMSHEIRTPMNSIIGMTQLTLDTALRAEQRENLEIVSASASALLGLIDDILDFSKIEAGRLDLEEIDFDLADLIEGVLDSLSLRAAEKGLELTQLIGEAVPSVCRGDPTRLRQVLINLVGNAIKFTERGEVVLHVDLDAQTGPGHRLRFRVCDTGIGIPAEQRVQIFEAFNQADNSTRRRYGGTGLGLTICRQLVDLMGGEIGVEAGPSGGSTFWFTIELSAARGNAPVKPQPIAELAGTHCLIVDDTEANRILLSKTLQQWQCPSTAVASGAEALAELRRATASSDPYDLVLLDMMMPEMDGEETARAIQEDPGCGDAPVLVLTSVAHRSDMQRLATLDVAGYLLKPIKRSLLRQAILAVLGRPAPGDGTAASSTKMAMVTSETLQEDHLAGLRLLLVEDKPFNQRVAEGFLKRREIRVTIANDGAEALARLAEQSFDLILMDVQMPVMDGLETTRRIRTLEGAADPPRHTPIVAMTAHAMSGDREGCLAAGMDDYVSKPIDPDKLYRAIARWAGNSRCGRVALPAGSPRLPAADDAPAAPAAAAGAPTLSTEESPMASPQTDPLAHLLSLFGDDLALVHEIVAIFLEDAPASLADLGYAIEAEDSQRIAAAAHALKGMARNFGLDDLGGQFARIEQLGRDEQPDAAWAPFKAAQAELEALYPVLKAKLGALSDEDPDRR